MGQLILGGIGAGIGSIWGQPMLGFSVGMTIGGMLFPPNISNPYPQDRTVQGSDYGAAIPIVFGRWRLAGQVVWANELHEQRRRSGGGSGAPSTTSSTYTLDACFMFCEGPVSLLKIWADADLIADFTQSPVYYAPYVSADMFSWKPGYTVASPDSTIASAMGASATPAYTNRATLTVNNFPWSRYGHTPNVTCLVEESASPTLEYVLTKLFAKVKLTGADVDFSALSGITVDGFLIPGRTDLASTIKPLQEAFHFDVVEIDGTVSGSLRAAAPSFALDSKWVGVSTNGNPPENPIMTTTKVETELPRSVDVSYVSAARDYQTANLTVRRITGGSQNPETLSLLLVLSDNHARQIGESFMYAKWISRRTINLTYPPNYLSIAPGDSGTVDIAGTSTMIRIIEQTMGLLGHIEAKAVDHDPSVYTQFAPGDGFATGSVTPGTGTLGAVIQDINAPADGAVLSSRGFEQVLIGAALGRAGSGWRGGTLSPQTGTNLYSADDGSRIDSSTHIDRPEVSIFGETTTALASADPHFIDTSSSVTVDLLVGDLSTCSDLDFMRGTRNLALIGSEWVQFRDVVQVSATVFTLSHLIRGKRGTGASIGTHASGEPFVLYDGEVSFWGTLAARVQSPPATADFTGSENGTVAANNVGIVNVPLPGNNLKCYSPCNIAATRNGSGDIALTWNRRSRIVGGDPWTAGLDVKDSSGRPYEAYLVELWVSGSLVKTYSVIVQSGYASLMPSPALVITAADQTTYGGGLLSPANIVIYQLNPAMPVAAGRGYPAAATV